MHMKALIVVKLIITMTRQNKVVTYYVTTDSLTLCIDKDS